jgi:TonB family protein
MKTLCFLLFAALLVPNLVAGQCRLDKDSLVGGTLLRYPPLAQQAQVGGEVIVSFDVDSEGTLTNVKALSGPALLSDSTAKMVKSWKLQSVDQVVTSVKDCRVVFNYSILPSKDTACNELVQPQLLRVSFEGAARVQVAASPRYTRICD